MAGKRLVVDTNITSSASESSDQTAINCRKFLEIIRNLAYQMVVTPDIWDEWNRHRSRFSQRWLTTMYARRLIYEAGEVRQETLRLKIVQQFLSEKIREEVLKDMHLLEAAMATDWIITSGNDAERQRFSSVCNIVIEINNIVWVNPIVNADDCAEWLKQGAPAESKRMLGYQSE